MSRVVEKRLIGAEDVNWDMTGGGAQEPFTGSDGIEKALHKINAGHIPLTTTARSVLNSTDVDSALVELKEGQTSDGEYYTKNEIDTKLGFKAPLSSPSLSGVPTAPTAASGTNTNQIATCSFVNTAFSNVGSIPVGTILPYVGSNTPDGWLFCDGSEVPSSCTELIALIGNTLPKLNDGRFLEGSGTAMLERSAGLPNIEGTASHFWGDADSGSVSGAVSFVNSDAAAAGLDAGNTHRRFDLKISASGSNSIYGGSTTVQPKSLTVRFIIKY